MDHQQPLPDSEVVLVIDDEPDFVRGVGLTLERAGFRFHGGNNLSQARQVLGDHYVDLILVDETLGRESGTRFLTEMRTTQPGLPCIVISGHADLDMALAAMRAGAVDMLPKPFQSEDLIRTVRRNLDETEIIREGRRHRWHASRQAEMGALVGGSPAMIKVVETIRRVAASDATVLIQGESGTGKELVANAIHRASARRHRELVAENVGSLSQSLLESTLFGIRKGSFTGATSDRPGLFEIADGSTLFLDEIGEATPEVQIRLLRALEERTITRVGDSKPRKVDVRMIAATNLDLREEVDQKRFRADLYYRLNVIRIVVPPLRERIEDVEAIAKHLLGVVSKRQKRRVLGFESGALDKLRAYSWPGNVRELRNVIESAVIQAERDRIDPESIVLDRDSKSLSGLEGMLRLPYRDAVVQFDRRYFGRLLERTNGNKSEAAELAGVDRTTLYKHLEKADSGGEE